MKNILIIFLLGFVFSLILMPIAIKILKKISVSQTILGYVENHKEKNGTTTMGGVVFLIITLIIPFFCLKYDNEWFVVVLVSVFFGILGFMDDFLKVKLKQNLGLRPYQKIIGQVGIAIIFALFIYFSNIGSNIYLPFSQNSFDLKWFIIPLVVFVLLATTNSVNLTDGIDGLAGNVSLFYLTFFIIISSIFSNSLYQAGETGKILNNIQNLNLISALIVGVLLGFLIFNTNKASVFMGDVGSLFLGGYIGASACLIGQEFLIVFLGFCFAWSAVSVILQVIVFKMKKKRVFKMAPYHHHLQMSGLSEPKIVILYSAVTVIFGIVSLIFYI